MTVIVKKQIKAGNKMSKIRIFVSHRIDIDSETVDSPVYFPVRCGAVFDKESKSDITGDDTGDNISELRMSFCEFTVQYWAWKNVDADYYGLCHYRRYLSFADKHYKNVVFNMVRELRLTDREKKKYHLADTEKINSVVDKYDMIIPVPAKASEMGYNRAEVRTLREMWESYNGVYYEQGTVDKMFALIREFSPEYYDSACEYFSGRYHRAFNCYIMKKELFVRMCEFQFPIMKRIAEITDCETYQRAPGYIGEMLNGIFIHYMLTVENRSAKEVQLVFFMNTDKVKSKMEYYRYRVRSVADKALRSVADKILPMYSPRREKVKKMFKVNKKKN